VQVERARRARHAIEPNRHPQHYHPRGIDYRIIPRFESHNACGTPGLWSLEICPPPRRPRSPASARARADASLGTKASERASLMARSRGDIGHDRPPNGLEIGILLWRMKIIRATRKISIGKARFPARFTRSRVLCGFGGSFN